MDDRIFFVEVMDAAVRSYVYLLPGVAALIDIFVFGPRL
jgi:hypothetical protein